ncbi:hypothetical protein IV203_035221 [Nitzschia inconspicua]|uniref:Uncharacterized protein n=1 Tax=Nitzschia inconspicua TaxID=303405 RepID=A0A9K3LDD6_9STRA|nr:hypothetical protein IV203_035221 [Nitzschia inconspicua]
MADSEAASLPTPSRRPRLSEAFSDELRQSVHKLETTREVRSSTNQRPRLSHAFTDELRKSVHKLEISQTNKYQALQRPKLSEAFTDELRKSVHDRQKKAQKKGFFGRPKLSDALADELRHSVHEREEKSSKKKGLFGGFFNRKKENPSDSSSKPERFHMSPVKEQKTPSCSSRGKISLKIDQLQPVNLSPSDPGIAKSPKPKDRIVVVKSPVQSPSTPVRNQKDDANSNKYLHSGLVGAMRQNFNRSPNPTEDEISRSERSNDHSLRLAKTQCGKAPEMDESLASYASFSNEVVPQHTYKASKSSKNLNLNKQGSDRRFKSHSISTFYKDTSNAEIKSAVSDLFSPIAGRGLRLSNRSRSANRSILDDDSQAWSDDNPNHFKESEGDIDAYRKDWIRLIKEKKSLKNKLATSLARNTLLAQQVDDLNAETEDLKSKLERWKEKAARLTEQQCSERSKFDNAIDLVTRARVELTKTTNENSKLKQQNFDLETSVASKDRLVEDLNETITRQADIIHKLSNKLKDQETTLRLSDDEKRRLEDEVAVLIAQREGDEMRDTFRQLEEERQKFFWQREMDLEAKRIELEKQRDWILEQDRVRHAKDMERLTQDAIRETEIDRERQTIQKLIHQQLEDMKEANRELRDKFGRERNETAAEMKERENDIFRLECEILELQKQLSVQKRSKKDIALIEEKAESAKDDLRDMKRHKLILEKEITKLKKKKKKGGKNPDGWREIIFPGYRGVSFGSEESEALAGFLTILVEEKGKKSKKAQKAAIKLERILEDRERKHRRKYKEGSTRKSKSLVKSKLVDEKKKSKSRSKNRDTSPPSMVKAKKRKKQRSRDKSKSPSSDKGGGERRKKHNIKKSKHAKKKHRNSRSNDDSVYIGNKLTLDEELELMLRETAGVGRDVDIDDTSMLVFKHNHHRQSSLKNRRSVSHRPSSRQRSSRDRSFDDPLRRSRSNPPPEIVLQ